MAYAVAFTVDPLFQQTSAQFDEGGAKGLLLNSLSVYHGCEIVFDSWEVPEKSMLVQAKNDSERHATVNLSFMKGMWHNRQIYLVGEAVIHIKFCGITLCF